MRTFVLLTFLAAIAAALPAQDDVLAVERKDDLAGRARAVELLKQTKMPLRVPEISMKQLCKLLSTASNDQLTFACSTRDSDDAPKMEFALRSASLWSIMAIAQQETGLRFVYRFGVVFVTKADRLKPLTYLRIYDLRAHLQPLRSFPGPDLRLRTADDDRPLFPEEVETGQTISGFTADGIEELVQSSVQPDSWSSDDVRLINQDGLFLIRQTPAAHAEIEKLLIQAGLWAPVTPRRVVRRPAAERRPAERRVVRSSRAGKPARSRKK